MKIKDKTVPYEILLRFDESGTLSGAHIQRRRILEVDGRRLPDELGDAIPLAIAAGQDGDLLADVLGEACAQALVDHGALQARVDEMAGQLASAAEALGRSEEALRQERVARSEAEGTLAALRAGAEAQVLDLQEQIARLRREAEAARAESETVITGLRAELDAARNPPIPSALDFLERLTVGERISLRNAAKEDPELEDILSLFQASQVIDPAAPRTREAFGYIGSKGYLPPERIAEVLA